MATAAEIHLPEINPQSSSIVQQAPQQDYPVHLRGGGGSQEDPEDDPEEFSPRADDGKGAGALLNRYDVDRFRKSFLNIIYVAMLEEGYNKSYKELFNLVTNQVTRRERAGPNSFIWFRPLLRDNRNHLETLSYFLCRCEEAERVGNLNKMYAERLMLAEYFKEQKNGELATHFYQSCLRISNDIDDDGLTHAQANCLMGDDVFSRGHTEEALEYFENYYSLCRDSPEWSNNDGVSLVQDACVKLLQVYLKIGDECLVKDDQKTAVAYYRKADEFAAASGMPDQEAHTGYKLALSLMHIGSYTEAIEKFKKYRDKCYEIRDYEGVGKAVDNISKALVRQGRKKDAIAYLSQYANEAKSSGHLVSYSEACASLAEIHNNIGNFTEAFDQSEESFNTLREATDSQVSSSFDTIMTQFGICRGNEIAFSMFNIIENQDKASIADMISWKNGRILPDFQKYDSEKKVKTPAARATKKEKSNVEFLNRETSNPFELNEIRSATQKASKDDEGNEPDTEHPEEENNEEN